MIRWTVTLLCILIFGFFLLMEKGYVQAQDNPPYPTEDCYVDPETGLLICFSSTAFPTLTPTPLIEPTRQVIVELFVPLVHQN